LYGLYSLPPEVVADDAAAERNKREGQDNDDLPESARAVAV
jgi:hypothetical protein